MRDFTYYRPFYEGFAIVSFFENGNDPKYVKNYVNLNEEILCKSENFLDALGFCNGFAIVKRKNHKLNYLTREGKLLSPNEDFIFSDYFCYNGMSNFHDGLAVVQRSNGGINYLKEDGTLLIPHEDFEHAGVFSEGIGDVRRKNHMCNYIKKDGTFLSPNADFIYVYPFYNGTGLFFPDPESLENRTIYSIDKEGNISRT